MTEDEITEELYSQTQYILRKSNISPTLVLVNQKIDRALAKNIGRLPSIDFCFRDRWVRKAFFGFECKLLSEGKGTLSQQYVDEGVCRYLEGKYCSTGSAGAMIGYVKAGNVSVIIEDVKLRVNKKNIVSPMSLSIKLGIVSNHFVSIHTRDKELSDFLIHHLFFKFC
jgi:hypothetical protein